VFILGYFVVVGAVLLALLMVVAETMGPVPPVIETSQEVGLREAFRGHVDAPRRSVDEPSTPVAAPAKDEKQMVAAPEPQKTAHEKHVRHRRSVDRETDGRGEPRTPALSRAGGEAFGGADPH